MVFDHNLVGFLWSVLSPIWNTAKYRFDSVHIRKNTDQRNLGFGQISRSVALVFLFANFEQVVAVTDVILTICGRWLLQNLEKRNKSNNFNRLQIEVFYLPNISPQPLPLTTQPPKIGPLNASFALIYTQDKLTRFWRYLDSFLKEHKTKNSTKY